MIDGRDETYHDGTHESRRGEIGSSDRQVFQDCGRCFCVLCVLKDFSVVVGELEEPVHMVSRSDHLRQQRQAGRRSREYTSEAMG